MLITKKITYKRFPGSQTYSCNSGTFKNSSLTYQEVYHTFIFNRVSQIISLNSSYAATQKTWYIEYTQAYGIWNFSLTVQLDISWVSTANEQDIELSTREEIPYVQATMYYFVYYINTFLTRRSQRYSSFKNRMHCHSFIVLDRMIDVSVADWRSQTHKIIIIFPVGRYSFS